MIIEPLVVLTVLNCFFMFSSTMTTCALWWQYKSHQCCTGRSHPQNSKNHKISNSKLKCAKSGCSCKIHKKLAKSRLDVVENAKSALDIKEKNIKGRKSKSNLKDTAEIGETEKTKLTESSQTPRDGNSPVVMEFKTIQKMIQVVDDNSDLSKLAIKNLIPKKDLIDRENLFESNKIAENKESS